jgi:hypothetical protein
VQQHLHPENYSFHGFVDLSSFYLLCFGVRDTSGKKRGDKDKNVHVCMCVHVLFCNIILKDKCVRVRCCFYPMVQHIFRQPAYRNMKRMTGKKEKIRLRETDVGLCYMKEDELSVFICK